MENLRALLHEPIVGIDKKCPAWGMTPLNFLAHQIDDVKFDRVFLCIQILIGEGANVNILDDDGMSPILHITRNENLNYSNKREILTYLIENAINVDIDSHGDGSTRRLLKYRFPDLQLPPFDDRKSEEVWTLDRLVRLILEKKEEEFLKGVNLIAERSENELLKWFTRTCVDSGCGPIDREISLRYSLLSLAIKKGLRKAVERMLRLGADINFKPAGQDAVTPIEYASLSGSHEILEVLLRSLKVNTHTKQPLVLSIMRAFDQLSTVEPNTSRDYKKCLQILINSPKVEFDHEEMLNYAIQYNNHDMILALLNKGAYIGIKNAFNEYSISNIDPKLIERHLNSCITKDYAVGSPISKLGEKGFEIQFNFKNFVPPFIKQHKEKIEIDPNEYENEMQTIDFISKSKELRHLIKHPLIQSVLFMKWRRLVLFFYLNILAYCLFSAIILLHVLLYYLDINASDMVSNFSWWSALFITIIVILCEFFQIVLSPLAFVKNIESYLKVVMLSMVVIVLCNFNVTESQRRSIAVATILLVTSEIFILLGSLEVFSTHFIMLKAVLKSFIRGFSLYIIILLAFALCFFALLNDSSGPTTSELSTNQNTTKDTGVNADLNSFSSVTLSLIKVFVMLTGELDAKAINFNLHPFSYLLFLAFLFLVSTVLLNLLNGLAVSDIQVPYSIRFLFHLLLDSLEN